MTRHPPTQDPAECASGFSEVAGRFRSVVDRVEELSEIDFLREIDVLLPLAYARARELPSVGDVDDENNSWQAKLDDRGRGHYERWEEVRARIEKKLNAHRWFRHVHDPVDPNDQEIHDVSLADELAEVYVGLDDGLYLLRKQDPTNALRAWNNGAETFWGNNAVDAIPAVSRLVRNHYDEDDEVFDI